MPQVLDHERLDVYGLALDFVVFANAVIEGFCRARSHLAEPFTRASMSPLDSPSTVSFSRNASPS